MAANKSNLESQFSALKCEQIPCIKQRQSKVYLTPSRAPLEGRYKY